MSHNVQGSISLLSQLSCSFFIRSSCRSLSTSPKCPCLWRTQWWSGLCYSHTTIVSLCQPPRVFFPSYVFLTFIYVAEVASSNIVLLFDTKAISFYDKSDRSALLLSLAMKLRVWENGASLLLIGLLIAIDLVPRHCLFWWTCHSTCQRQHQFSWTVFHCEEQMSQTCLQMLLLLEIRQYPWQDFWLLTLHGHRWSVLAHPEDLWVQGDWDMQYQQSKVQSKRLLIFSKADHSLQPETMELQTVHVSVRSCFIFSNESPKSVPVYLDSFHLFSSWVWSLQGDKDIYWNSIPETNSSVLSKQKSRLNRCVQLLLPFLSVAKMSPSLCLLTGPMLAMFHSGWGMSMENRPNVCMTNNIVSSFPKSVNCLLLVASLWTKSTTYPTPNASVVSRARCDLRF